MVILLDYPPLRTHPPPRSAEVYRPSRFTFLARRPFSDLRRFKRLSLPFTCRCGSADGSDGMHSAVPLKKEEEGASRSGSSGSGAAGASGSAQRPEVGAGLVPMDTEAGDGGGGDETRTSPGPTGSAQAASASGPGQAGPGGQGALAMPASVVGSSSSSGKKRTLNAALQGDKPAGSGQHGAAAGGGAAGEGTGGTGGSSAGGGGGGGSLAGRAKKKPSASSSQPGWEKDEREMGDPELMAVAMQLGRQLGLEPGWERGGAAGGRPGGGADGAVGRGGLPISPLNLQSTPLGDFLTARARAACPREVVVRVVADVLRPPNLPGGGGPGGGGGGGGGGKREGLPFRSKAVFSFQRVDRSRFPVLCFGMYVHEYGPGKAPRSEIR